MKKLLLLLFVIFSFVTAFAQLEVKQGSFKVVDGFVNINTEKMYDDNNKPYAVLKVRTENINDKQRRELNFGGDAQTFFETEYKDGEVWLYISYYATFIKFSHPDLSSTEFWFPFDMEPKKGYELTLVNKSVDEELVKIRARLEELEKANTKSTPANKPETKALATKSGKFSVGANKKVFFSSGNLQYQASTNKWRFAEHQWRIEGKDNNMISNTNYGWIDLFGWGTGNDPTKHNIGSKEYAYYDWGNNIISNGGYVTNLWRTLSKDEWVYLIQERKTQSGIRYAKAQINGVNGLIVLPDDWDANNYSLKETNKHDSGFTSNIISTSDWKRIEKAGAVFLPASGERLGTIVAKVGTKGCYWSNTNYNSLDAYYLMIGEKDVAPATDMRRHTGGSVRLVRDAE